MKLLLPFIFLGLFFQSFCQEQTLKLTCSERQRKNPDFKDSIIIQTCLLKNFKFVTTSYPDDVGRYFYSEHQVYIRTQKGYVKTTNSKVFNQNQNQLVTIINKEIQEDFRKFSSDSATKECFIGVDSIPEYEMNDFEISFNDNDIWFEVHWDLSAVCRSVDGTIVSFNIKEIQKYLK